MLHLIRQQLQQLAQSERHTFEIETFCLKYEEPQKSLPDDVEEVLAAFAEIQVAINEIMQELASYEQHAVESCSLNSDLLH
jgi:hypothetical protein